MGKKFDKDKFTAEDAAEMGLTQAEANRLREEQERELGNEVLLEEDWEERQ